MSEVRCKPHIGQIVRVYIYDKPNFPPSCAMFVPMQHTTPDGETPRGSFRLDGKNILFSPEDARKKKWIVYESVTQVQKTTRGTKVVRLRP
jgi:hypothetical protein